MYRNLITLLSINLFPCLLFIAVAQPSITMKAECGQSLEAEFTNKHEEHDIKIPFDAGDRIEINLVPVGKYLRVGASVLDPGNAEIIGNKNDMFNTSMQSFFIKTEELSASGIYTIKVVNYNTRSPRIGAVGMYRVFLKCFKSDGRVLTPK